MKAKDIMDKKVVSVSLDTSLRKICEILIKNKLSGIVVVDSKKHLCGFISERDIILRIARSGKLEEKTKDAMQKKVFSVEEDTSDSQISKIFLERPFRYLPVVRKKKVVGIISRKDVVDKLLGDYY